MEKFVIDGRYAQLFEEYGLDLKEILTEVGLAPETFTKERPLVAESDYYHLMELIEHKLSDPLLPVKMATQEKIEQFSPPIFAAYCSQDGQIFITRIAQYKKLIGPMTFKLKQTETTLTIELHPTASELSIPRFIAKSEFAFIVGMLRKATGFEVRPQKVQFHELMPKETSALADFFLVAPVSGAKDQITFALADLKRPFKSHDQTMWDYFEPELKKRLAELAVDDSVSAKVRNAITESLASGLFSIEDISQKLGYSKRTLQRRLKEENTTFQEQLNSAREILALHYLKNTMMTTNDIAYLLGYQELNSFLRAFIVWRGISVSEYRAQNEH